MFQAASPLMVLAIVVFTVAHPALARNVLDLQRYKKVYRSDDAAVRFVDISPKVNRWFILQVKNSQNRYDSYHIENPKPDSQRVLLNNKKQLVVTKDQRHYFCDLVDAKAKSQFLEARTSGKPFAPICQGRLFMRNAVRGQATVKEKAVEFIRNKVWGGESVLSFIKNTVYKDSELIEGAVAINLNGSDGKQPEAPKGPKSASLNPSFGRVRVKAEKLGLDVGQGADNIMQVGVWYPSVHNEGIYVSVIEPRFVDQKILNSFPARAQRFDNTESSALAYMVAFDMEDLSMGYSLGTQHPEVTYSERTYDRLKTPGWEGPDGISSYDPLVSTGMMNPEDASKVIATFTAGFKRKHSVFRAGPQATRDGGTHYGFMQNGTVFSTLYPSLATVMLDTSGNIQMKTWTKEDDKDLDQLVFARQNGFPLVYRDHKTGKVAPHKLVGENFRGNWSGTKENSVRALRTGLCMQTKDDKKFLMFGFFSSHTPSALARVFQAYDCDYAMHLDMNLIVHTYLATYFRDQNRKLQIEHIIDEMADKDGNFRGEKLPRFVAIPDNRDFFYLVRKSNDHTRKEDFAGVDK